MEDSLDRAYLTIEDFLNSNYIRSDDIDHARSPDSLQLHFNKPGFDLAIILTDKSLIPTISEFQAPFQTKHGLTTHVIYLPDVSRLKFCIRDLKLHEILYAIIVSENSRRDDEYDVFILSDIIEFQKGMKYVGAVNLIDDDFTNYMKQMKLLLNTRNPHAMNKNTEGFIEPTGEIRYLLCLLFDHRMLNKHELQLLSSFVRRRKEAILNLGKRQITYGMNDRPMPSYRQDKLKYYVYEHKPEMRYDHEPNITNDIRRPAEVQSVPQHQMRRNDILAKPNNDMRSCFPAALSGQPQTYKEVSQSKPTYFDPKTPSSSTQTFSKNAIIESAPKLYKNQTPNVPKQAENTDLSPNKANQQTKNAFLKPQATKTAIQSQVNQAAQVNKPVAAPYATPVMRPPVPGTAVRTPLRPAAPQINNGPRAPGMPATAQSKSGPAAPLTASQAMGSKRIKFAIAAPGKPVAITHSNVAQKPVQSDDGGKRGPSSGSSVHRADDAQKRYSSANSSIADPLEDFEKDNPTVSYNLSPVSDDECAGALSRRDNKLMEIDLTDDVSDDRINAADQATPPKRPKYSADSKVSAPPSKSGTYVLNLSEDNPSLEPKNCQVNCNVFINFFKFVLNTAPLALPESNVVVVIMKKCLQDLEKYSKACNLTIAAVEVRAVRTGGCVEVLRIIEAVTSETMASKHNASDLGFMWTYFPRNMSDHSVTVMFYKMMKILEQCKLVAATNTILATMMQRIERVAHCSFQLSDSNATSYTILNFFPSLFSEYYEQRFDLHNLNSSLPTPEAVTTTFNPDMDKTIIENKIKFVVGPLLELFIDSINSVHHDLESKKIEDVYWAVRAARFSLRRISTRLIPDILQAPVDLSADVAACTIGEMKHLVKEVYVMNCMLFTRKHYELINVMLDFAIHVRNTVQDGCDPELELPDKEYLIHFEPTEFVQQFSTNIKTSVLAYHPDTEIDIFKSALKNRWIDTLHQAFKGLAPMPEGVRIASEMEYLLPKCWGKHAFSESVAEAALLSYSDWDKMLTNDFGRSRVRYSDVRNNYLLWLAQNRLDHRKAMETMTSYQKTLDSKILQMSS